MQKKSVDEIKKEQSDLNGCHVPQKNEEQEETKKKKKKRKKHAFSSRRNKWEIIRITQNEN